MNIINSDAFVSIAILKAKLGKVDFLRQELLAMIEPTRKEEGCLEYVLYETVHDSSIFYMREAFVNKAAFDLHLASPHFQFLSSKFDELLLEPVELIELNKVSS